MKPKERTAWKFERKEKMSEGGDEGNQRLAMFFAPYNSL
jgi:hypothetical protein